MKKETKIVIYIIVGMALFGLGLFGLMNYIINNQTASFDSDANIVEENNSNTVVDNQNNGQNTVASTPKKIYLQGRILDSGLNAITLENLADGMSWKIILADGVQINKLIPQSNEYSTGTIEDLVKGSMADLNYSDTEKKEVDIIWIQPPFDISGAVANNDGSRLIVTDGNTGLQYTVNYNQDTNIRVINGEQVSSVGGSEILVGEKVTAISDYGVDYNKTNFDALYIELSRTIIEVDSNGNDNLEANGPEEVRPVDVGEVPSEFKKDVAPPKIDFEAIQ